MKRILINKFKGGMAMLFLFFSFCQYAQTPDIPIQVINSCGGSGSVGNIIIDYNVGEVAIATIGTNPIITQGFLQPDFASSRFYVDSTFSNISCFKKKDGKINLIYHNAAANATIITVWSPNICPNANCAAFDTLSPGNYSVVVKYDDGTGPTFTTSATFTIANTTTACPLNIFNIVTPNGDGQNDIFYIENIEQYDSQVYIYNRWGQELANIPKYNNTSNYWTGTVFNGNYNEATKNQNLPSGTYFYTIDLKDGSKLIRGYIELIRP